MPIKNRQQVLAIVAIAAVGYFAADKIIFSPLTKLWKARSDNIADLRKKVSDGQELQRRADVLQNRWDRMRNNMLPTDSSVAEQQVLKAFDRWSQDSGVSVNSISPQPKHDADEYTTLEVRVDATGNLNTITRFLYSIEKDPMALRIDSVELTSRDNTGSQLTLALQTSGLALNTPETRP